MEGADDILVNTKTSEISSLGRRKQKVKYIFLKKLIKNLKKKYSERRTFPRILTQLVYFLYSPSFLKLQQNFKSTLVFLLSSFCVSDVHKVRAKLDGVH